MKDLKKIIMAGIATIATMTALVPFTAHAEGMCIYPTCARVTAIHGDVVTVTTVGGFVYKFYGDDYDVDDLVALIMDNNGTKGTIEDDKIISAQYSGYFVNRATNNISLY